MPEPTKTPGVAVVPPPLSRGDPLPPGVDYIDELFDRRGAMAPAEDPISLAAGSSVFIERPGAQWLPWAVTQPHPQRPPVLVRFTRYYPALKLCVDMFPAVENVERERLIEIALEVDGKRELCRVNGCAYVAVHGGDAIDGRTFAEAQALVTRTPAPPAGVVHIDDGVGVVVDPGDDPVSAFVGTTAYHADASIAMLPWAYRPLADGEWAQEPLVFHRYYWTVPLLMDLFPARERLAEADRTRLGNDARFKERLCAEHGIAYLAVWGGVLPSRDALPFLRSSASGAADSTVPDGGDANVPSAQRSSGGAGPDMTRPGDEPGRAKGRRK